MLALARARLARPGLTHCAVRLADMYRLPLADAGFDLVVMQMVLHYAEDPEGALSEAARVLRPGGRLVIVDLAPHRDHGAFYRLAHRWDGFPDVVMIAWLSSAGLTIHRAQTVQGPLDVRIWAAGSATLPAPADLAMEAIR
jgi:ArsR family transcriptional regulator